jgi:hypothetical protein
MVPMLVEGSSSSCGDGVRKQLRPLARLEMHQRLGAATDALTSRYRPIDLRLDRRSSQLCADDCGVFVRACHMSSKEQTQAVGAGMLTVVVGQGSEPLEIWDPCYTRQCRDKLCVEYSLTSVVHSMMACSSSMPWVVTWVGGCPQ